jgi:ATP-binding protein involved in chromosome partitioning
MKNDALFAALTEHLPPAQVDHVKSASMIGGRAIVVAEAGAFSSADQSAFEDSVKSVLGAIDGVEDVRVAFMGERRARRIIAVGSGKGGVGKSTLTTNLAIGLSKLGHSVGVVDADIYGPSQPKLLGTEGSKPETRNEKLIAIDSPHGVKVLSMGHLAKPAQALAWRGPMVSKALDQLIDADWGSADILLLDLPPGTGDVQISMLQKHRPVGAVLVSTPQDLALIDAARAGQLFEQGDVPIIGLVENMAGYVCPHCGEVSDPFGQGGFEQLAQRLDIPFLGRVPLSMDVRISGDEGQPIARQDTLEGIAFQAIAEQLSNWLAEAAG